MRRQQQACRRVKAQQAQLRQASIFERARLPSLRAASNRIGSD
jgi:hypothetical protein